MPLHHLQHIAELGPVCEALGVRHVIIAPGSRNAPLIQLFTSDKNFCCHSIVDERSAGYLALGMAKQESKPVLLITTSGTAVLNLSPALAEAFKQQVPILVLTADRPREMISQFNNQVIDQRAPYFNYSKGFLDLPAQIREEEDLEKAIGSARGLFREAQAYPPGPVHLNLPLTEPLYEALPAPTLKEAGSAMDDRALYANRDPEPDLELAGKKVLILAGMGKGEMELIQELEQLPAAVVAENISNLHSEHFISVPELVLAGASDKEEDALLPDLVIGFGLQVVSKRLKLFLQKQEEMELREIEVHGRALTDILKGYNKLPEPDSSYPLLWKEIEKREIGRATDYLLQAPFGNLSAVARILEAAPANTTVHLGNSSTIRYSQLVRSRSDLNYFSNRGISGIDGSLSTAVGAAMISGQQHLLILGDLSFVYDSNALWNKHFPENLKIVVLNDGGGGIFRLLDGPDRMDYFEEFSVTHHPVSLELLSTAFGLRFSRVATMEQLEDRIGSLWSGSQGPSVLEVDTTGSDNRRIYKDLFK